MKKLASLLLVSVTLIVACTDDSAPAQQKAAQQSSASAPSSKAKPVNVITVTPRDIELSKPMPGRVEAYTAAEIRPQVNGIVESVNFQQGSLVNKGQQLYQIDDAQYKAQYQRAKANLQTAQANLELAQLQYGRIKTLLTSNAVSQQELDSARTSVTQAEAAVALAEAEVEAARINVEFTKVYAPISGYIGPSTVTQGALVSAQQATALAVIRQFDPIYVDVAQSASQLQHLQGSMLTDRMNESGKGDYKVQLLVGENDAVYPHQGRLFASDLAVEQSTGTTRIRIIVDNPDTVLLPGMYVRARIQNLVSRQYILIPQKAVSLGEDGAKSVWLVGKDNTTSKQTITTSGTYEHYWVVDKGLQEGDVVIVEGTMMITPGTKVAPRDISRNDDTGADAETSNPGRSTQTASNAK
ncbi:efflux RND transporter periplasmic adaptor subunit [Alteromonas gilva]|uniref:Efflux RND transporter periplasmic adaptor subunit n=1 Tax=Alteromonas gilva TaxID=2987522 RepID=A0ABT5L197_9ALTE|nr:efflux RND transporter periplasmic adaptor subunit [Alteromonas gilva]MDC8830805.1 efflux RND transporter periplasmic adaptor subunit [Alteromonas gilva]